MKFKYGDSVLINDDFFGKEVEGTIQDYQRSDGIMITYKVLFNRGASERWFIESQLKNVKKAVK